MKIAVLSDIHDNIIRLQGALEVCHRLNVKVCICCGDIQSIETLKIIASAFDKVLVAFGNGDYQIKTVCRLIPENIQWSNAVLETEINNLKIAIVHYDYKARHLAKSGLYDFVFYGHSHTPWEKRLGKTIILNPGEIAGQFGIATFAIFDTGSRKAELKLLK